MPKSKRDRQVSLTATKKKGLEFKQNLITVVRECLDTYENAFIISMFNQRNQHLKDLRQQWSDSRFIFGKNKVIGLALGRGPESEYKPNIFRISPYLVGNVGILFTNKSKEEVLKFFEAYSCPDYARAGNIALEDVTIKAGNLEQFQHTMEPQLRQLSMHTSLKKGVVHLDSDFKVCSKGDKLTPEQCRLLKLFDKMHATFQIKVKVFWTTSGHYEVFDSKIDDAEEELEEEDEDEDDEEEEEEEEEEEDVNNNKKKQKTTASKENEKVKAVAKEQPKAKPVLRTSNRKSK